MDNAFRKKLIALRRQIHRHPELGNEEFHTTALIETTLKKAGIATVRPVKTGVVGILRGERAGSGPHATLALRGDIDALPVHEKTGKPYASSRPGVMHACGHDANATMVLGAALLLARRPRAFSGSVKFIFQPNEESSGGAKSLIDAGVLRKPDVDAIIGIHVNPWLPAGALGLKPDEMMAAVDRFTIEIVGGGGHGAYPHLGKDAIVAAAHVVLALQSLVAREIDPVDPAVVTIGTVNGGERFNILCGRVTMVGTVRTLSEDLHASMRARIARKLRSVCHAFGVRHALRYEKLGCPLRNSDELVELCRVSGEKRLGRNRVIMLDKPSMGGEDFSEYLRHVPGCFMYMGAAPRKSYPWHHEKFDINEDVLPKGAELLADIAKRYLNK